MPDSDPAVIAVEKCGCVTIACCTARHPVSKAFEREMLEVVRNGGSIVNTTVGKARAMPDFLPVECPHNPKGWAPQYGESLTSRGTGNADITEADDAS